MRLRKEGTERGNTAGSEGGGRGHEPRGVAGLWGMEKAKKQTLPRPAEGNTAPALPFFSSTGAHFGLLTSRTI